MIIANLSLLMTAPEERGKKASNLMFLDRFCVTQFLKTSILFKPEISIHFFSCVCSTHLSVGQHICCLSKPHFLFLTALSLTPSPKWFFDILHANN